MSNPIYQVDQVQIDPSRITTDTDQIFGPMTVFHDVVIASEMVQQYDDGRAFKCADELKEAYWTWEGRWVTVGGHPDTPIIMDRDQIGGRTVNVRYTKSLKDQKTKRPMRHGITADLQIFDDRVAPELLADMKSGKKPDVSIGFFFERDETPGTVQDGACMGEDYDYIQRKIFGDHTAAGIDNGRCPNPWCGLGADQILSQIANDPFAGFASFNACLTHMTKPKSEGGQGYTEEQAKRVCGSLQAKSEKKKKDEDEAMNKGLRILARIMLEEIEDLKGMKDAKEEEKPTEWWRDLDWKEADVELFDALPEETRQKIEDAGLCPTCDEEEECPEGKVWNEEHTECVPEESEEDEYDEYETWIIENIGQDVALTSAQKRARPDSDYAYIEPGCKKEDGKTEQKCRHFLIYDHAHVVAALAALKGARTGKIPKFAKQAKPKICAAAKKFKVESEVCGTKKKKKDEVQKDEVLDPLVELQRAQRVLDQLKRE